MSEIIHTIGYQRITPEILAGYVRKHRITVLVDVRSRPYGRRHEFNKKKLQALFSGIYAWKGDVLGGFEGDLTDEGIALLKQGHALGHRILLMCMEHDPDTCHRKYDIAKRLEPEGYQFNHIVHERGAKI